MVHTSSPGKEPSRCIRRLLWAVVLFVAVTLVTYMIFYVIPANPARLACGQRATETCIRSAEHRLGLNRPVPVQYAMFMKRLVIDRSLGRSFTNRQDVNQSILDAATRHRLARVRRSDPLDAAGAPDRDSLRAAATLADGQSLDRLRAARDLAARCLDRARAAVHGRVPARVVPNAGYCDFISPAESATCGGPVQWAYHLVLPWVTFALLFSAIYVRMIRAT